MLTLKGLGTSPGISAGRVMLIKSENKSPEMVIISDSAAEIKRAQNAIESAKSQLRELYNQAVKSVGEEGAAIFDIHEMMLEEVDYIESIYGMIEGEHKCAEYAIYAIGCQFSDLFRFLEDAYMRERAVDVLDVSRRVVRILTGAGDNTLDFADDPVIVAAEELMPSETIQMDKSKIAAFVTKRGATNSHVSILARGLGIPAVAALGESFEKLTESAMAIVDGTEGVVIISPDEETNKKFNQKFIEQQKGKRYLEKYKGVPAYTLDGCGVELCANIGHPNEVALALENDAEGIGLFRSEFLYLESLDFPDEETQFCAYKAVLERLQGRRAVIRTLDLGSDKQAPYFDIPKEDNPALGYRAIRIELDLPEILITQLRALLRASVYGKLAVLIPMITTIEEIISVRKVLAEVKKQLSDEGIPYAENIELGIMIETPAAVIMADRFAKEVDFFSVGTNDLTQYTLAADRMNSKIAHIFNSGNPAVLRLVAMAAKAAHENGIRVGICGESAADLNLLPFYIGMGIDELSMASPNILKVKEAVSTLNSSDCKLKIDRLFA